MNFAEINDAVMSDRDVNETIDKNEKFYIYLLNNKVAYYYASQLSSSKTKQEEDIVARYNSLHIKFVESMRFLDRLCKENEIDYLLYKTYRYVPEPVDGDIDIIVKKEDFQRFLKIFSDEGFYCIEDEPGKGKCEKDGFCVIEPHVNVSWRGGGYLDEDFLWTNTQLVDIEGSKFKNVSFEVEAIAIAAKILFEPSYLDLFSLKTLKYCYDQGAELTTMLNATKRPELLAEVFKFCDMHLNDSYVKEKMPTFLPTLTFIRLWSRNLLISKDVKVYFLHSIFYFYWKIRYRKIDILPFTHHAE